MEPAQWKRTFLGNKEAWDEQSPAVHFRSLLLPLPEAAKARDCYREKHEEPQRRLLPLGRSRRGAAKRGAGGRPEARRGGVALRFPSLQVPGSPAGALPAAPSLLCPRLRSCRQLLGDGERLVLSSSLPGGRGLGAGVRRGLNQDLFVIPAAGEVRGTSPTQRGAEVGAGEAGQQFPGMSSGPCLPPRAVGSVQLSPNLSLPGTWTA